MSSSCPKPSRTDRDGPPGATSRRSGAVVLTVALLASVLIGGAPGFGPSPASAQSSGQSADRATLVVEGRGWGHGRGMGQYGALGYARDFGWSSAQILDHYYGGTTAGQAPTPVSVPAAVVDPAKVRVDLVFMRGRPTTVALADGVLHLMRGDGSTIGRVLGAVRLTSSDGVMQVETGPSCDGPWAPAPATDGFVRIEAESSASDEDGLLQACGSSRRTWYDGELWATTGSGRQRTINLVSVEEYLQGVVPNEVPASWPEAVLEAQAVAARSYALAGDPRWTGFADTCDTTLCQVYDGRYTTRLGFRAANHPRTDAAIAATNGLVRLAIDGSVARTEFSSSTGGWTAGGDFPAVIDEGDAVSANPNSQWRVTIDVAGLEARYQRGTLLGVGVVERNGLGPDGGRAEKVELRFDDGSVVVDGDDLRRQLGLKSNWYTIGTLTRGGVVQPPIDPQAIARYIDLAYRRLEGRPPTTEESARWQETLRQGSRSELTTTLVRGPVYSQILVDDLYQRALGRQPDAGGRSYWVQTLADGLKYEHLGTLFYGSPEYVARSGGTAESFVDALYLNILGRPADDAGRSYWVGQLDSGRANSRDVANSFYRSLESRRDRATATYERVMGSSPGASLVNRLADRLAEIDDLTLAADLAVELDHEQ